MFKIISIVITMFFSTNSFSGVLTTLIVADAISTQQKTNTVAPVLPGSPCMITVGRLSLSLGNYYRSKGNLDINVNYISTTMPIFNNDQVEIGTTMYFINSQNVDTYFSQKLVKRLIMSCGKS